MSWANFTVTNTFVKDKPDTGSMNISREVNESNLWEKSCLAMDFIIIPYQLLKQDGHIKWGHENNNDDGKRSVVAEEIRFKLSIAKLKDIFVC